MTMLVYIAVLAGVGYVCWYAVVRWQLGDMGAFAVTAVAALSAVVIVRAILGPPEQPAPPRSSCTIPATGGTCSIDLTQLPMHIVVQQEPS